MKNLLQLNTSIFAEHGQSTQLAGEFARAWQHANPLSTVTVRDFSIEAIPHLTAERFQAFLAKPDARTDQQRETAAYSDALIDEVRQADVIVIGLPMYNYGVPSMLQSWFDHVARAGVTFRYTETGPVGAFTGKQAVVFATRGGIHAGTPTDTQSGHVRDFFRLIGIDDVQFVYAEGMGMGAIGKAQVLAAQRRIAELTVRVANDEDARAVA